MKTRKLGIVAFITLLATFTFSSIKIAGNPPALAQDPNVLRAAYQYTIDTYQAELAKARKEGNRQDEVRILNNAGYALIYFEQYQKAIALLEQMSAIAKQTNNQFWQGMALDELGPVYFVMGNYAKAIELQKESLAIYQTNKILCSQMYTVAHLGLTQARAGQLASAETSLQEAIKISENCDRRNSPVTAYSRNTMAENLG